LARDFEFTLGLTFGLELLRQRVAPHFNSVRQLIEASQTE
jgi:hypothetical protein